MWSRRYSKGLTSASPLNSLKPVTHLSLKVRVNLVKDYLAGCRHLGCGLLQSGHGCWDVLPVHPDCNERLSGLDSRGDSNHLAPSLSHSILHTVCTSSRDHLVLSEIVVRLDSNSEVVVQSARPLGHMTVRGNTSSLKSLVTDLAPLKTYQRQNDLEVTTCVTHVKADYSASRLTMYVTLAHERRPVTFPVAMSWSLTHFNHQFGLRS